jgi:cytochrome c biogenesis factor
VILVGELALWVALLMAAWGAIVSFTGGRSGRRELITSGERALYATFACVVLATSGLLVALVASDFSFTYVASFTSANLPVAYRVTALWAGQAGSLLVWTLILSMYAAVVVVTNQRANRAHMPYVVGALSIVLLVLLAMMCLGASPYERRAEIPVDGRGMHPQLQSPGMAVHPPLLYLGYVATTIPHAFAIGALLVRRVDDGWVFAVRRWAAVCWFFLTIGIVAGMWWAYVEPGRGGEWALDPMENFSIVPWITTTGLLYALIVQQERGVLRRWSVVLAASSFLLVLLGAFIIHNGIIAGAHALAPSGMANWLAGFVVMSVAALAYLVATRLHDLPLAMHFDGALWREQSSSSTNRLRIGRYAVRVGGVVLAAAFVGLAFRTESDVSLGAGEETTLVDPYGRQWTFTSQGVSQFAQLNRRVVAVPLRAVRDGKPLGLVGTERRQYVDSRGVPTFEAATEPGIDYSLSQDVYVVLRGVARDRADLRIAFNPLAVWVWIGGAVVAIGGLLIGWPPQDHPASGA